MSKNSQSPKLLFRDVAFGILAASVAAVALIGTLSALAALAPAAQADVRLKLEQANPNPGFVAGRRKVKFRFEIAGKKRRDVVVQAVQRSTGKPIRRWRHDNVAPGKVHIRRWNGSRSGGGPAPEGRYFFRVKERGGKLADRKRAKGGRGLQLRQHRFPVRRARHSYGDGYGAGRGHRGVDIFAPCGKPIVAARAGRVQHVGRGGSAGNYVVIDGRQTGRDYVYMHLKGRPKVRKGDRVKTGELIGRVGQSGNASGCHLHFELWSPPGWYEGGSAIRRVKKIVRNWDRFD